MFKVSLSSDFLIELNNILMLLEYLNNYSQTIEREEIKKVIDGLKQYLNVPDYQTTIFHETPTNAELIQMMDLYRHLASRALQTKMVYQLLIKYIHTFQHKIIIEKSIKSLTLIQKVNIENSTSLLLDVTPSYIVIDTDISITLLDKNNFTIAKTIHLDFINSLHHYYIHQSEDKLMLYYGDQTPFLLFVDLDTEEQKIISLNNVEPDIHSPFYVWDSKKCIIATYDQIYWEVDIVQGSVGILSLLPKRLASCFNTLFALKQKYSAKRVDFIGDYIVFENSKGTYSIIFSDSTLINTPIVIRNSEIMEPYHDFYYKNGIFIAISEYEIQVANSEKVLAILKPESPFLFYRAKILNYNNKIQIVILMGSGLWQEYSNVMIFEIDDNT